MFIFSKKAVEQGGALYEDYHRNCRPLLADGALVDTDDNDTKSYMEILWTTMTKDNSYREWMSHKRSNAYQAMQDKFMSEFLCAVISSSVFAVMLASWIAAGGYHDMCKRMI